MPASAQTAPALPRLDVTGSVAVISARMPEVDEPYYQDWYAQGRYAGTIGFYITKHLKAELEHAWSGEGSRMLLDYTRVAGQPYPLQVEQSFQLQQTALRVVWQFRDNAWVHPYLGAGAVLDTEHQRLHIPPTYQPGPRGEPLFVSGQRDFDDRTVHRGGVAISGGAKFYVSPRAFINAGAIVTYSKPAATVSWIAGAGVDF